MNSKIALVGIVAEFDRPYLQEWIEWHRSLGFQKFILFLNNWKDKSIELDDPDGVELICIDGTKKQVQAYNTALFYRLQDVDWALFADADEFLHILSEKSLDEILDSYSDIPVLASNWRLFGCNGHKDFNGDYSVQKRFTRCCKRLDQYVKVFVNVKHMRDNLIAGYFVNPHFLDISSCNFRKEEFDGFWDFADLDKPHELEIWHYAIKSLEECKIRRSHKRADNGTVRVGKELETFMQHYDKNEIDCSELKYTPLM